MFLQWSPREALGELVNGVTSLKSLSIINNTQTSDEGKPLTFESPAISPYSTPARPVRSRETESHKRFLNPPNSVRNSVVARKLRVYDRPKELQAPSITSELPEMTITSDQDEADGYTIRKDHFPQYESDGYTIQKRPSSAPSRVPTTPGPRSQLFPEISGETPKPYKVKSEINKTPLSSVDHTPAIQRIKSPLWRVSPSRQIKHTPKPKDILPPGLDDESGFLLVRIIKAKSLSPSPIPRDLYCTVQVGTQEAKTRFCKPTLDPHWDDLFNFMVESKLHDTLKIFVVGKEVVGTEVALGEIEVGFVSLEHFKMTDFEKELVETESGTISLKLRYISLNYNIYKSANAIYSPKKEEQHFDRYGFLVESQEAYQQALKTESEYNSEVPSLVLGCQRAAQVGIGFPYKARFWQIFAMRFLKLKESPFPRGLYESLLEKPGNPAVLDQITKDLPRTFPNHPAFVSKEGRQALGRILKAFSIRHPQIGYTQSMNFISGYLLLLMQEELAFKLLTIIVEYYVPGYYMHTMAGLQADQLVLNSLVQEKLPRIHNHLQQVNIDLNVVTTKWFLCLFIHVLPFPSVLRIWDILFCKGSCALILAAFAIISFKQEEILCIPNMGHDSLDNICQNYYNWEELIAVMFSTFSFGAIEKLQEDAREKVALMVERSQIEELQKRTSFSQTELLQYYKKFSRVSKNGSLNLESFTEILPDELRLFTSEENVLSALFNQFDKNGFGIITYRDFGIGLNILLHGNPKEKIEILFRMFDIDQDNFISKEELKNLLSWQFKSMGFSQVEEMVEASVEMAFSTFDIDKDSKLSIEEFSLVLKKQPLFVKLLGEIQ